LPSASLEKFCGADKMLRSYCGQLSQFRLINHITIYYERIFEFPGTHSRSLSKFQQIIL